MKKAILRIQGHKGGHAPVMDAIRAMRQLGIPFVQTNSGGQCHGSAHVEKRWSTELYGDLLYVMVREIDAPKVVLAADGCHVIDESDGPRRWTAVRRMLDDHIATLTAWQQFDRMSGKRYNGVIS